MFLFVKENPRVFGWQFCRLLAGAGALVGAQAARADDAAGVASSRMSYSRFLEYLEMGRVKKVRSGL